jgi:kumamolisin
MNQLSPPATVPPLAGLNRNRPRGLGRIILLVWALAALATGLSAADASRIMLSGSIHEEVVTATAGRPRPQAVSARRELLPEEAAAEMEFGVSLSMRNFDELQARLAAGEVLPPEEMAAKYWPLAADEAQVAGWLQGQGFTLVRRDENRLVVFASGPVSRVAAAFQTTFSRVTLNGTDYTSAITVPSMPAEVGRAVLGINGLQPQIRRRHHGRIRPAATGNTPPFLPAQIAKAYHADGLAWNGSGQIIGIVIDTPPRTADLTAFWKAAGVAQSLNNIQTVQVISGTLPKPEGEESLDVEWSSAMAPAAKVRVYATRNLSDPNLDRAYQQIYQDAKTMTGLRQVSLSYGIGETEVSTAQLQTDAQLFANLASIGITVFASSGDDGSSPDGTLQPSSPASDVNVTGVGGTSLVLDAAGAASSETAWNGSGGGISSYFSRPAWQKGAGVSAGTKRLSPDVSLPADPNTGAVIYLNGARLAIGGTSWSSPTWAGICALINQARAGSARGPVGVLGAKVYPLLGTANFRDITGGNNGSYSAGPGYDLCTGLGVPNVAMLIQTLTGAPEITAQPVSLAVNLDQNATFAVAASSPLTLSYQWQQAPAGSPSWSNLAEGGSFTGTKTSTLSLIKAAWALNGNQLRCLVSTSAGAATSETATLTVRAADLVLAAGSTGTLTVGPGDPVSAGLVFTNAGNLPAIATKVYLYFSPNAAGFDSAAKAGEINLPALAAGAGSGSLPFTYQPPAETPTGTYFLSYWIDASGLVTEGDENNNRGSLTVQIRTLGPAFTSQPTNQAIVAGADARFAVTTRGTPPLAYHWQRKPSGGTAWENLTDDSHHAGTSQPILTVSRVTPDMNGDQFQCVVNNSAATITSNPAGLAVSAADLTVSSGRVLPTLGVPGTTFTRTIVVTNLGNASSPATLVDFFVSPKPSQFSGGTKVGSVPLPALAVGASASLQFTYQSPADGPLGTYSFYYVVDGPDLVTERNEANNTFGANITLNRIETHPLPVANGRFQLLFRYADGSAPSLDGWKVQWRNDPPIGTDTNWNTFTAPLYLTNGFVGVTDTNASQQARRFFRITGP